MTAKILALNLIMLAIVLETDLGRRKITLFRVARPFVAAVVIVPFFFAGAALHGWGLGLEVAGAAIGLALGLLASALLPVHYDLAARRSYSRGGIAYALLWIAITGARLFFSYGAEHLFGRPLGSFMVTHNVSAGALADAFIFLSLAMFLARTASLGVRGYRSRRAHLAGAAVRQPAAASRNRVVAGDQSAHSE